MTTVRRVPVQPGRAPSKVEGHPLRKPQQQMPIDGVRERREAARAGRGAAGQAAPDAQPAQASGTVQMAPVSAPETSAAYLASAPVR